MSLDLQKLEVRIRNPQDAGPRPLSPDRVIEVEHSLAGSGLFDDAALELMLNQFPPEHIEVATMDETPNPNRDESKWRQGMISGLSGADILRAVRGGRLWLNLKLLDTHVPEFDHLMTELYTQLCQQLGVPVPAWRKATMLISSPQAWVYYHADAVPNVLWHVRGGKRIHIYPHDNPAYAHPAEIESLCSGSGSESLSYRTEYEAASMTYDLQQGAALMWPQNGPHRVVNTSGLNVTLLTEHIVPAIRRKVNLQRGNGVLRSLGFDPQLSQEASIKNTFKAGLGFSQHVVSKCRSLVAGKRTPTPTFLVDPNVELGYRELPQ